MTPEEAYKIRKLLLDGKITSLDTLGRYIRENVPDTYYPPDDGSRPDTNWYTWIGTIASEECSIALQSLLPKKCKDHPSLVTDTYILCTTCNRRRQFTFHTG